MLMALVMRMALYDEPSPIEFREAVWEEAKLIGVPALPSLPMEPLPREGMEVGTGSRMVDNMIPESSCDILVDYLCALGADKPRELFEVKERLQVNKAADRRKDKSQNKVWRRQKKKIEEIEVGGQNWSVELALWADIFKTAEAVYLRPKNYYGLFKHACIWRSIKPFTYHTNRNRAGL